MASESKVYKKRPHRKVKSGCSTCKRRKIKCDEEKPACSNCVRYSAECIYPSPQDSREQTALSSSTTPPPIRTPESLSDDFQNRASISSTQDTNDLHIGDLALMHQWTIATCFGFGDEFPGDADAWQFEVPILAQQYPFLMRGILAVSALHLARNFTDPALKVKYLRTAAYHQDLALPEYRNAIVNVNEKNVSAVLAFSAMITVYSFAAPKDPGTLFATGPPEWLFLHRGVGEIPSHWQNWIDSSFLKDQMHRRRLVPIDPTINPEDYRLVGLLGILTSLPPEEQHEAADYEGALHWLRQAFAHTCNPESRLGSKYGVLYWIEHVSQGYLELLGLQKPRALVLLAHCCILLKRASHFWYLDGFAEHVISELKPYLSEEFLPWIEWPMQVCAIPQNGNELFKAHINTDPALG